MKTVQLLGTLLGQLGVEGAPEEIQEDLVRLIEKWAKWDQERSK